MKQRHFGWIIAFLFLDLLLLQESLSFQTAAPWSPRKGAKYFPLQRGFHCKKFTSYCHRKQRGLTSLIIYSTTDKIAEDDNSKESTRPSRWSTFRSASLQIIVGVALYMLHLIYIVPREITLPFQLIRNPHGHFASLSYDCILGIFVLLAFILRRQSEKSTPWKLDKQNPRFRITTFFTVFILFQAYFLTGQMSLQSEDFLLYLSSKGFPLTTANFRSWSVLLGHLNWIFIGLIVLKFLPRPPAFFGSNTDKRWFQFTRQNALSSKSLFKYTLGGYILSCWLFQLSDVFNRYALPDLAWKTAEESVVSQLVSGNANDRWAAAIGCIAPCVTAPFYEEILYRGFLLPVLAQMMPFWLATAVQGIIFSVHHMSLTATIPLAVLGWIWAIIYRESGQLLSVICIHMMWNSRVFLAAWLGIG